MVNVVFVVVADDNGGGRGLVIRQFSKRSVKSPVRNWQNLRNLLTKSRDLHLVCGDVLKLYMCVIRR